LFKVQLSIEEIREQFKYYTHLENVKKISDQYKINEHLFDQAFFRPTIDLNINYNDDNKIKIYHGNKIEAKQVTSFK
jgi:hypothetical protein